MLMSQTKPQGTATARVSGPDTVGRTKRSWSGVPRAAPIHAHVTRSTAVVTSRFPCTAINWRPPVTIVPTILYPLPDVAVHVVQAPDISWETAHRCCLFLIPLAAATNTVGPVLADVIPPTVFRSAPGPRRILPLRLRRQAVTLARLCRQPRRILRDIVPGDVDNGAPPAAQPSSSTLFGWGRSAVTGGRAAHTDTAPAQRVLY